MNVDAANFHRLYQLEIKKNENLETVVVALRRELANADWQLSGGRDRCDEENCPRCKILADTKAIAEGK